MFNQNNSDVNLKQEMNKEIDRVMQTVIQVKDLIKDESILRIVNNLDQMMKD